MKKLLIIFGLQNVYTKTIQNQDFINSISQYILSFEGDILFITNLFLEDGTAINEDDKQIDRVVWESAIQNHQVSTQSQSKYLISWDIGDYEDIEIIGAYTDTLILKNIIVLNSIYPEKDIHLNSKYCLGTSIDKHNLAIETLNNCSITIK